MEPLIDFALNNRILISFSFAGHTQFR